MDRFATVRGSPRLLSILKKMKKEEREATAPGGAVEVTSMAINIYKL